jgi:hypothetical protein
VRRVGGGLQNELIWNSHSKTDTALILLRYSKCARFLPELFADVQGEMAGGSVSFVRFLASLILLFRLAKVSSQFATGDGIARTINFLQAVRLQRKPAGAIKGRSA